MTWRAATSIVAMIALLSAVATLPSVAWPTDLGSPASPIAAAAPGACSYPWVEQTQRWMAVSSPTPFHSACERCLVLVDPSETMPRQQLWWEEQGAEPRHYGVLDLPTCGFLLRQGSRETLWRPFDLPALPADVPCKEPHFGGKPFDKGVLSEKYELCVLPSDRRHTDDPEVALWDGRLVARERASGAFLHDVVYKMDQQKGAGVVHSLLTPAGEWICTLLEL